MITLIGMGSGTPESLTAQGLAALQNAGLILGAKRLLEQLPQGCTEHRKALYQPEDVLAALAADPEVDAALVYSGDTGFYSGAAQLLPMLRAFGISCRVLPGLSSVQLLAAAVGRSWQEWKLLYTALSYRSYTVRNPVPEAVLDLKQIKLRVPFPMPHIPYPEYFP